MHSGGQQAKFIGMGRAADGKTVAFGRLKADEPRKAQQGGRAPCTRTGRGKSVKDQTPCLT